MTTTNYRNSAVGDYIRCPLAFNFAHNLHLQKIDDDSGEHHRRFGQAIHSALQVIYVDRDLEKAKVKMRECYPVQLDAEDLAKTVDNACFALEKYVEHYDWDKEWTVLSTEETDYDGSYVAVTPDMIVKDRNDNIFIVDHKTAQPLTAKVLTRAGWVEMSKIVVGRRVFGADGKTYKVLGIYPQGEVSCYEVTFDDGSKTQCSLDHLWTVTEPQRKKSITVPLSHIVDGLKNGRRYRVPLVSPINHDHKKLLVPAYLLGALLGDGCIKGVNTPGISIGALDEKEMLSYLKPKLPLEVKMTKAKGGNFTWCFSGTGQVKFAPNKLAWALGYLGLWGKGSIDKFIPPAYINSSVRQRLSLLQGLMDTDGCCWRGHAYFDSISVRLAEGVVHLVRSLGGHAKFRKRKGTNHPAYRVTIKFNNGMNPFRLLRKRKLFKQSTTVDGKYIKKVAEIGTAPMQCIKVSAPDGLYITDEFTVTHNTGRYLNFDYFADYDPNSQVTHYVQRTRERYGHCDGFIVNAIRFAFLKRASKDRAAGFNVEFERQVFQRTSGQIQRTERSTEEWIEEIEHSRRRGHWRAAETPSACKFCSYKSICSAGWSWEDDEELITNVFRRVCQQKIGNDYCNLDLNHSGGHRHELAAAAPVEFVVEV